MEANMLVVFIVGLFIAFLLFVLGKIIGSYSTKKQYEAFLQEQRAELEKLIKAERSDAVKRSRAVLSGQFSEQLAPFFPEFPAEPTEVRFIGKPIDFIAFSGSSKGFVSEVLFIEVKSGSSSLSSVERSLRDALQEGRIRYVEYRVPNGKNEIGR